MSIKEYKGEYSSQIKSRKLVVIGAGAAGFFCAVNAARLNPSLHIIILEKTNKLLSKVRISGGGRCNVTHACFEIEEMSKCYPRGQNFVRKAFYQFFTTDTIKWFNERNIQLKTEKDGRIFPVTDSSQAIISCLLNEANSYGIDIRMNVEAKKVIKDNEYISIELANGEKISAEFVCIACGGYTKSSMFNWLKDLGHNIFEPVPSLFTFNLYKHSLALLMGISVEKVRIKIEGSKLTEEGPILITHWGLSGPAVLRLSAWGARELSAKNYEFKAHIKWLPEFTDHTLKLKFQEFRNLNPSKKIINQNFSHLPNRLWKYLLEQSDIHDDMRIADLTVKTENQLIRNLIDFIVEVKGKTVFKEEFVTAGGIQLNEVDNATMMSKKVQKLYFAGEILDVDGITGGYNFQHAWTSGWIAAKDIAEKSINPVNKV